MSSVSKPLTEQLNTSNAFKGCTMTTHFKSTQEEL
jgi:hypothetical protein